MFLGYLSDIGKKKKKRMSKGKINAPDFIAKMTRRRSTSKKRRMGQFYKTSYFQNQLMKIGELPEDEDEGDDAFEYAKSAEESKSNSRSISNENTKSIEMTKSKDLSKSGELSKSIPQETKESNSDTSSLQSSVSSHASTILSPIKPFSNTEYTKRVSNISVESLTNYNKRKSEGKSNR